MKINDLKKMCNGNLPLLKALNKFTDLDINTHVGKWDFELNYGDEYCIHCLGSTDECDCDEPENKDEYNFFSGCAVKYIDEYGDENYDSFDDEFDELQGTRIGNNTYNIFFCGIGRTIHIFNFDMLCDGVVEGFFDFDSYKFVNGKLDRDKNFCKSFLDTLQNDR